MRPTIAASTKTIGNINRKTSPSFPSHPAVVVPKRMVEGPTTVPMAPPAVCAARIAASFTEIISAAVFWKLPSRMFDEVFDEVTKAPNKPRNGTAKL